MVLFMMVAGRIQAEEADLACADPSLSTEDFMAAVGPHAAGFKLVPGYGQRCVYESGSGTTIRIETRASGNYASVVYNSKKEEDDSKVDFSGTKPIEVPGLGSSAYKIADHSNAIFNVLDRSKSSFFEIEVKVQQSSLHADEVAKRLARVVESNSNKDKEADLALSQAPLPQPSGPTPECEEKLSDNDIQRITGWTPDQYEFKSGADHSCGYHARTSQYIHRILRFSPEAVTSRQETLTMLATLRNGSSRPLVGIGSEAGALASDQLWFVSSNRKWIVTVSYREVGVRDSDQEAITLVQQEQIRDAVARTIDHNLNALQ